MLLPLQVVTHGYLTEVHAVWHNYGDLHSEASVFHVSQGMQHVLHLRDTFNIVDMKAIALPQQILVSAPAMSTALRSVIMKAAKC